MNKNTKKLIQKSISLKIIFILCAIIVICFFVLYFLSFISICGDSRCDIQECGYCKNDCEPAECVNGVCDLIIGENCNNSRDCFCLEGYVCEPNRHNANEKGCYKTVCGDNFCDKPYENEENCCLDCNCSTGYTCDKNTNRCILLKPDLSIFFDQLYKPSVTILLTNPDLYWNSTSTYYESNFISHPLFQIKILNSGGSTVKNLEVRVKLGNYSDWSYKKVDKLREHKDITLPFNIVVYSSILEVRESTKIPVLITLEYDDIEGKHYVKNFSSFLEVYGREYIDWKHPEFINGWITFKDPIIREFAVKATKGLSPVSIPSDAYKAAERMWNQLSGYGVRYISDPLGTEYISFPSETLKLKGGDCEDLAILFAALLASVGIKTEIVILPNHVLIAFYAGEYRYCVETTKIGEDFSSAVREGYSICKEESDITIIPVGNPYISPPSSINVGYVPIPDIKYLGSEWTLISNDCILPGIFYCLEYHCEGKCIFTFQNMGEGSGRKCGTFYAESLYTSRSINTCVDVVTTATYELPMSWYAFSSLCSAYCSFYEE